MTICFSLLYLLGRPTSISSCWRTQTEYTGRYTTRTTPRYHREYMSRSVSLLPHTGCSYLLNRMRDAFKELALRRTHHMLKGHEKYQKGIATFRISCRSSTAAVD
ncbi:hypothetical protein BJX96DRAFT_154388 [Aspergillus floccosus]